MAYDQALGNANIAHGRYPDLQTVCEKRFVQANCWGHDLRDDKQVKAISPSKAFQAVPAGLVTLVSHSVNQQAWLGWCY